MNAGIYLFFAGKIMHQSADELITYFQSDLMVDFGFDDDYAIQSLVISMQELHRMKLDLPAPPRPDDAVEKPTKPFGCFEPPSVEELIASMQMEAANGDFVGRPSIPADGGPVIVPDALLKRNASDWSFLCRENDDMSSSHVSVAATDVPSSRTSLVSSLLDNIGILSTASEPSVISFVEADSAVSSRMTPTCRSPAADQISNSEYDNVPPSSRDEFSSMYEEELEQTLESIEQEIQELLGKRDETVSSTVTNNDYVKSHSVSAAPQQNHVDAYACHSPHAESSAKLDSVSTSRSLTSELHSTVAELEAVPSPSTAVANSYSAPVILWSNNNSYQSRQKPDDSVVIPIQHLPSTASWRPPVKPKPKTVAVSPSAQSPSSASALTPIPVLHLRTVPISQFSGISALSATKRSVPTSSTNGC